MSTSPLVGSLRSALNILPLEWVLWAVDAEGVFLVHEGPGAPLPRAGSAVGRSVWEVYREDRSILTFAARVLREPASAELISDGTRFHISGTPVAGGGAVGMALVLGCAEDAGRVVVGRPAVPSVLELLRPVPEVGARRGDLLVWNPERPDTVGFYREVQTSRLPRAVARDLGVIRSSGAGSAPAAPAPGGAARPLRERASHLRVVS